MTRFFLALSFFLLAGYPALAEQSVAELNDLGVAVRRELSVSGLSLLSKGGKYYVEGLLINRTRRPLRSVTVDMELTLDDATEEFETIFLKGIGPETSKSFEKGIEIESKTAKPVMATVIKINSLDFESFDMYKPLRKSK